MASAPTPSPSAPPPSMTAADDWQPRPGAVRLLEQTRRRCEYWAALDLPPRLRGCRLDTFPDPTHPALAACREWLLPGQPAGLLLCGAAGRGKTGLALGLAWELMDAERRNLRFAVVPDLLDELRQSYRQDAETDGDALLRSYRRVPVLVLDDIGAERDTPWVMERLYVLVNARHRDPKLLTIFTSNLAPSRLEDRLGERIAWRIIEMSRIVPVDGPNLRDRLAE